MHLFKRIYLLLSTVLALAIPLITFTEYIEAPVVAQTLLQFAPETSTINAGESATFQLRDLVPLILAIYASGLVFFGLKFCINLRNIFSKIRNNPKHRNNNTIKVLLQDMIVPHTFFKFIFLNKREYRARQIPQAVITHEETHANQWHSLDVIFIELLQVLLWFHPLIYISKGAIKLNHEFLADQAVLRKAYNPIAYQETILGFTLNGNQPALANAINYSSYSSIKKRFTVMKKQTSRKSRLLRSFLLLPILVLLLYGFSETKKVQRETANDQFSNEKVDIPKEKASLKMVAEYNKLAKGHNLFLDHGIRPRESEIRRLKQIYGLMTDEQKNSSEVFPKYPERQDGASKKQISEYNALAKKYNKMIADNDNIFVEKSEVDRLEYIYSIMTNDQKAKAESYPEFPPMPEPTPPPSPQKIKIAPMASKGSVSKSNKIADPTPPPAPKPDEAEIEEVEAVEINEEVIERVVMEGVELEEKALQMEQQQKKMEKQAIEMEEQKTEMESQAIEMEEQGTKMNRMAKEMEEQRAKMEKQQMALPPLPPTPKSPLDHIIEMAKKDAVFYYQGKEISSDRAIEVLKQNKSININTKNSNSERPIVRLSTKPIKLTN